MAHQLPICIPFMAQSLWNKNGSVWNHWIGTLVMCWFLPGAESLQGVPCKMVDAVEGPSPCRNLPQVHHASGPLQRFTVGQNARH